MAYLVPWDESSPDGAITPAADIDVELQDLKTSVAERLEQVIPGWRDDLVDPKVIPSTVIDNSSAFSWAIYKASITAQVIPNDGVQVQVPLVLSLNVPGDNPWGEDSGNIVLPDDGSYVMIASCGMELYSAAHGLMAMKTLVFPSGPSQHNDPARVKNLDSDDQLSNESTVAFSAIAMSIVKEAAAGDKVQAYATSFYVHPDGGLFGTPGIFTASSMTIFALRVGA